VASSGVVKSARCSRGWRWPRPRAKVPHVPGSTAVGSSARRTATCSWGDDDEVGADSLGSGEDLPRGVADRRDRACLDPAAGQESPRFVEQVLLPMAFLARRLYPELTPGSGITFTTLTMSPGRASSAAWASARRAGAEPSYATGTCLALMIVVCGAFRLSSALRPHRRRAPRPRPQFRRSASSGGRARAARCARSCPRPRAGPPCPRSRRARAVALR
jgi:hypothetical protein